MAERTGLCIKLMRKTAALNLLQCLRPDTHISIPVRMTVGNRSNKDSSVGLNNFGWWRSVIVLWSVCLHIVIFRKVTWRRHVSEFYGVFVNDVTNMFAC